MEMNRMTADRGKTALKGRNTTAWLEQRILILMYDIVRKVMHNNSYGILRNQATAGWSRDDG